MYWCRLNGRTKSIIVFLILAILTNIHISRTSFINGLFDDAFKKTVTVYLNYQTKTFEVLNGKKISLKYSEVDKNIAPFMLATAEDFYLQVKNKLNFDPGGEKILVIVYPDQTSLNDSIGMHGDRSAVGVYWAGSIRLLSPYAMLKQEIGQKAAEKIFIEEGPIVHELTHYLVDKQTGGNYTRWLTEGLAQYLEREITGYTLESPDRESRRQLYSLSSLDKDFDKQPDELLAYWQSLQAVTYLIDEHGIGKMRRLLTVLGQGTAINQAFWQVYQLSPDMLDDKVWIYIQ